MNRQASVGKALLPSLNFCFSLKIFNVFMLILKSKPINTTNELIKISIIKTIIVPIEPYNDMYDIWYYNTGTNNHGTYHSNNDCACIHSHVNIYTHTYIYM